MSQTAQPGVPEGVFDAYTMTFMASDMSICNRVEPFDPLFSFEASALYIFGPSERHYYANPLLRDEIIVPRSGATVFEGKCDAMLRTPSSLV